MLNEKYRSDDNEEAKSWDYNNLNVIITLKSPLFGNDWIYHKSFKTSDFVCGQIISVNPHEQGKKITDWSNWGKYNDLSEIYCKECAFVDYCGIIKRNQRYITIN